MGTQTVPFGDATVTVELPEARVVAAGADPGGRATSVSNTAGIARGCDAGRGVEARTRLLDRLQN